MKITKLYKPKYLVPGHVIGKEGRFVAVPDRGYKDSKILVKFGNDSLIISDWNKAATYRRFHDKHGNGDYTLGYFDWAAANPNISLIPSSRVVPERSLV